MEKISDPLSTLPSVTGRVYSDHVTDWGGLQTRPALARKLVNGCSFSSRSCLSAIDVLKVDMDGFDGEIIVGATNIIRRHHPAIIFEWHPKLILATGRDPH